MAKESPKSTSLRSVLEHTLPEKFFTPQATNALLARTVDDNRGLDEYIHQSSTASDVPRTRQSRPFPEHSQIGEQILEDRLSGATRQEFQRRYALGALIGRGANGYIYSVEDRDLQREIAAKVFVGSTESDMERLKGFLQEARITASLEHPNILPVYDIGISEDKRIFFTMRKVAGISLGEAIRLSVQSRQRHESIASHDEVVRIFLKVCDALEYAHSRGVIHQDVKPDNIMLGEFGEVLLLDWGSYSSSSSAMSGVSGGMVGTPAYMSPEQARREGASVCSDVYSLGASFFHVLTLRHPTWAADADGFWEKKRQGVIDSVSEAERSACPNPLLEIALKALENSPSARYRGVREFADDLKRYQQRQSVSWRLAETMDFSAVDATAFPRQWAAQTSRNWSTFESTPLDESVWSIVNGRLRGASITGLESIHFRRPLHGDLRVIWTGRCLADGQNLNCFIAGANRQAGYTFHIGALGSSDYCMLTKGAGVAAIDYGYLKEPLQINTPYRICMEIESGHIRLFVDNTRIITFYDPDPLSGPGHQSFGFESLNGNPVEVEAIEVYYRPLATHLPPIAVANSYFNDSLYEQAIQKYEEIKRSYPHDEDAAIAEYKIGLCHHALGHNERARESLIQFERSFPYHELIPHALLLRASLDEKSIEPDNPESLYAELARRFPGHGALKIATANIAGQFRYRPNPAMLFQKPELLEVIDKQVSILMHWHDQFGLPYQHNRTLQENGHIVAMAGMYEFALQKFSGFPKFHVKALLGLGRYDEIFARFPEQRNACATILSYQYKYDTVLRDYPDQRSVCAAVLRSCGKLDQLLEEYPEQLSACAGALVDVGRCDEALERYPNLPWLPFHIYRKLGRLREYLDTHRKAAVKASQPYLWLRDYETIMSKPNIGHQTKVSAMLRIGQAREIFKQYPGYDYGCCNALIVLGRADEALERYRSNDILSVHALQALHRYTDILDSYRHLAHNCAEALENMGEFQRILELYPESRRHCSRALLSMGRFDELLEQYSYLDVCSRALMYQGEFDRAIEYQPVSRSNQAAALVMQGQCETVAREYRENIHPWAMAMIYADREDELRKAIPYESQLLASMLLLKGDLSGLEAYRNDFYARNEYQQSQYMAAIDMLHQGGLDRFRAEMARLGEQPYSFRWEAQWFARFLLSPVVEAIHGNKQALRQISAESGRHRYQFMQQLWYAIKYIAGDIDEERFNTQPTVVAREPNGCLCRGIRAEIDGDQEQARQWYRRYLAKPAWSRPWAPANEYFVKQRLAHVVARR
jgi:serine/threonine protein kinase